MNLIEKISQTVNCHKLAILVKEGIHSRIELIRAADYNYYSAKYGHENIELIANARGVEVYETYRTTIV